MGSLEESDREAAAVAIAPRVTLEDIKAAIARRFDADGTYLVSPDQDVTDVEVHTLSRLSVCLLVMKNGFMVVGTSAPASPENFNAELGRKLAYEDAVRQLWPLLGFKLRSDLYEREQAR